MYNTPLKPGRLEQWGTAKLTYIKKLQSLQSTILVKITNIPFHVSNQIVHSDLLSSLIMQWANITNLMNNPYIVEIL